MSLKSIMNPLKEIIGNLTGLLQELVDTGREQTETLKNISARLDDIDEKLNQKSICNVPEDIH